MRESELGTLWKSFLVASVNSFLLQSIPALVSVLTFAVYVLMGNTLTAANAFTSLSLFTVCASSLSMPNPAHLGYHLSSACLLLVHVCLCVPVSRCRLLLSIFSLHTAVLLLIVYARLSACVPRPSWCAVCESYFTG